MRKLSLLFILVLGVSIITSAQVLSNFNDQSKGVTGFEIAGDSGPGLDSLYWTQDPSNPSNGVMAMAIHWDSAGWHGRMELGDGNGNATYVPGGNAKYITFWIYIDSTQHVPDSMTIDSYAMDNTNWAWTEPGFGAKTWAVKDIPHNTWFPISYPLAATKANNPNFQYNAVGAGKGFMTGLQMWPSKNTNTVWSGVIYVDNVVLVGALPHGVAGPGAKGFEKSSDSGPGLDSIYTAADPTNPAAEVMAMAVHWDSAGWHGRMDLGDGSGNATYIPGGRAQFVTFWVYIDSSQNVPDSMTIDSYAMDNTNWAWTEPGYGDKKWTIKDIPHNTWYPMAYSLAATKANNPNFQYNAVGAGKGFMTGLQFWPDSVTSLGWSGVIYVKDVALLDTVTEAKPSVWTAANFESKDFDGLQSFYVPKYASGTIKRFADLVTSNVSYVLQGTLDISQANPMFAVVRDTVPMKDAVSDSAALSISFQLYLPKGFPDNAAVNFFVSGGTGDSVSVMYTVGSKVKSNQWNTLTIGNLDSLATAGKFDPNIPAKVGVQIWYPAPYDTTSFSGKIEFDNLKITGFAYPRQLVDGVEGTASVIKEFKLYNNYPNPFNPSTMIKYDLPKASKVVLKVYDVLGREIATLVNGDQNAGSYKLTFNMDRYASGVYFVRMVTSSYQKVQKMMLIK